MKPKDSQEVAMSKFIRLSLKDITNLKKPPSTPCSQQEPKTIPPTITSNLSSIKTNEPLFEEPEPINLVYDTCDIGNNDSKEEEDEEDEDDNKNHSFSVFNSESTIYGEEQNPNNVSVGRMSVGSNYSDELADMTPTQVSQALADTLQINDDGKRVYIQENAKIIEKRYLHSFHTVCHIRTLLEALYPSDLDKEEYKKVAKTVTAQFIGSLSENDFVKPLVLSPTRKDKIQRLLDQELTKTVMGRSLF